MKILFLENFGFSVQTVIQTKMSVCLIIFPLSPPAPRLVGLNEQMKAVRKRNETSVIDQIGEDLLIWVRKLAISF